MAPGSGEPSSLSAPFELGSANRGDIDGQAGAVLPAWYGVSCVLE